MPDQLAWWTFYAAIAASVIGLFTLAAVGWQIWLARRAVTLAAEELTAVKDDFSLAQRQFDLAQKQFNLVMRSPDVVAQIAIRNEVRQVTPDGTIYREVNIHAEAVNQGTKVSRHAIGDVFVPTEPLFRRDGLQPNAPTIVIKGKTCETWPLLYGTLGRRMHPTEPVQSQQIYNFKPDVKEVTLFWRFNDDEYCYPEHGYGEVRLTFKLTI